MKKYLVLCVLIVTTLAGAALADTTFTGATTDAVLKSTKCRVKAVVPMCLTTTPCVFYIRNGATLGSAIGLRVYGPPVTEGPGAPIDFTRLVNAQTSQPGVTLTSGCFYDGSVTGTTAPTIVYE